MVVITIDPDRIAVAPGAVTAGVYRFDFDRAEGMSGFTHWLHMYDEHGTAIFDRQTVNPTRQTLMCAGAHTVHVTDGAKGPDVAPPVTFVVTGQTAGC
jgi:hypothetical protein